MLEKIFAVATMLPFAALMAWGVFDTLRMIITCGDSRR